MAQSSEKDTKEAKKKRLDELRGTAGKIAVAILTLSGWCFLFMNGTQTPVDTTSPAAIRKAEEERKASGIPVGMQQDDKPEGTFVMSYSLVLLSIGLGLMFVSGSSNRRDRAHIQQYEGFKVTKNEDG
jgi:hypothetical protein